MTLDWIKSLLSVALSFSSYYCLFVSQVRSYILVPSTGSDWEEVWILCSALLPSLFERDMVLLCDIPLTPPVSLSFYKRVSENLPQAKIDERSMLGHIYMYLSLSSKCSESKMLKTLACSASSWVTLPGSALQLILLFMLLAYFLKQHPFISKGLENQAGIGMYNSSSLLKSGHPWEEMQLMDKVDCVQQGQLTCPFTATFYIVKLLPLTSLFLSGNTLYWIATSAWRNQLTG